ncbi:hypothetical protein MEX01_51600 [Methylorubrum extorquens]|uniref:hypothetical protein n=1 Tax=Methylorubrum extorquens TaxID=408 RepID=UPI001173C1D1|nr:hypothetical protein [Methylorubrum extorquens]GEL44569.1 hypothetical protein MEX01_51600 [Methylorubrum extorquens]
MVGQVGSAEGLAAYEFEVFEEAFRLYGNAESAKRNRDEIARMFREGAPATTTAAMIQETQTEHDGWVREDDGT